MDVAPTLLELAGAQVPAGLDGRSLVPLLRGDRNTPDRSLFAMEHYYGWENGERWSTAEILPRPLTIAVLRDGRWFIAGIDGEEVYEAEGDPDQSRNLAGASEEADLERLRSIARTRLGDRPETPLVNLDDGLREELRALGYVE